MGSKRLTPTTVEKMASKCLLLLLLYISLNDVVLYHTLPFHGARMVPNC